MSVISIEDFKNKKAAEILKEKEEKAKYILDFILTSDTTSLEEYLAQSFIKVRKNVNEEMAASIIVDALNLRKERMLKNVLDRVKELEENDPS